MCIFHLFCSDGAQLNTANTSHEKGGSDQSCIESMVDEMQAKDRFNSQASASSHPDLTCFSDTSKVSPSDIQNSGLYCGKTYNMSYSDIQNTGSGLYNDETSKVSHPDIQNTSSGLYYDETSKVSHPDIQNTGSGLYYDETSKVSHPDIQNTSSGLYYDETSKVSHPDIQNTGSGLYYDETSKVSHPDIQNTSSGLYYDETSKLTHPDIQNTSSGLYNDETSKLTHPDIQITGLYKNKTFKMTQFDIQDSELYYGETSNMLHPDIQNSDLYCGETSKVSHPDIQNSGLSAIHLVDHCYGKPSELQFILIDHCYSETSQVSHVSIQNSSDEWNFTNDVLQNKNQESDVEENIDETLIGIMEVVEIHDEYENLRASLQRNLKSPYVMNTNAENIEILSFYESKEKTSVKYRITVDEEFHVCLKVHNVEISRKHEIWDGLPKMYTEVQDIDLLLSKLNTFNVCCGNHEKEFHESFAQIGARITLLPVLSETSSSEIHASGYREGDFGASDEIGNCYDSTIRSVKCVLLVKGMRCCHCKYYRQSLQNRKYRIMSKQNKNVDFNASKYQHCYMTREMLIDKINQQKNDIKTLESEMTKLKRQYRTLEHQKKNEIQFLESRISKLKRQDKINQQKN